MAQWFETWSAPNLAGKELRPTLSSTGKKKLGEENKTAENTKFMIRSIPCKKYQLVEVLRTVVKPYTFYLGFIGM